MNFELKCGGTSNALQRCIRVPELELYCKDTIFRLLGGFSSSVQLNRFSIVKERMKRRTFSTSTLNLKIIVLLTFLNKSRPLVRYFIGFLVINSSWLYEKPLVCLLSLFTTKTNYFRTVYKISDISTILEHQLNK